MTTISHRNQEILQMRREGSQTEVARRFNLSPTRIYLIEKQDAATRAMEGRRARMIKQLQDANDMDKLWPVNDLLDALGLIVVTRWTVHDTGRTQPARSPPDPGTGTQSVSAEAVGE